MIAHWLPRHIVLAGAGCGSVNAVWPKLDIACSCADMTTPCQRGGSTSMMSTHTPNSRACLFITYISCYVAQPVHICTMVSAGTAVAGFGNYVDNGLSSIYVQQCICSWFWCVEACKQEMRAYQHILLYSLPINDLHKSCAALVATIAQKLQWPSASTTL